jgi:hypothetical protein
MPAGPFRNLIHPAAAFRQGYDPRRFTKKDLDEFKELLRPYTRPAFTDI